MRDTTGFGGIPIIKCPHKHNNQIITNIQDFFIGCMIFFYFGYYIKIMNLRGSNMAISFNI